MCWTNLLFKLKCQNWTWKFSLIRSWAVSIFSHTRILGHQTRILKSLMIKSTKSWIPVPIVIFCRTQGMVHFSQIKALRTTIFQVLRIFRVRRSLARISTCRNWNFLNQLLLTQTIQNLETWDRIMGTTWGWNSKRLQGCPSMRMSMETALLLTIRCRTQTQKWFTKCLELDSSLNLLEEGPLMPFQEPKLHQVRQEADQ